MKKQYMIAGIMMIFFIISGICYSCSYAGAQNSTVLLSSDAGQASSAASTGTGSGDSRKQDNTEASNGSNPAEVETDLEDGKIEAVESTEDMIYIHICGAVVYPDVYQVKSGARLIDVLELCGGLSKDAAGDYINQAVKVTDGQRIYIPNLQEVEKLDPVQYIQGESDPAYDTTTGQGLVNINTAGAKDLMELPGIGQAKADGIIAYRNKTGGFKTVEDLMNIPGIKEGLFNQISSYITVK